MPYQDPASKPKRPLSSRLHRPVRATDASGHSWPFHHNAHDEDGRPERRGGPDRRGGQRHDDRNDSRNDSRNVGRSGAAMPLLAERVRLGLIDAPAALELLGTITQRSRAEVTPTPDFLGLSLLLLAALGTARGDADVNATIEAIAATVAVQADRARGLTSDDYQQADHYPQGGYRDC